MVCAITEVTPPKLGLWLGHAIDRTPSVLLMLVSGLIMFAGVTIVLFWGMLGEALSKLDRRRMGVASDPGEFMLSGLLALLIFSGLMALTGDARPALILFGLMLVPCVLFALGVVAVMVADTIKKQGSWMLPIQNLWI